MLKSFIKFHDIILYFYWEYIVCKKIIFYYLVLKNLKDKKIILSKLSEDENDEKFDPIIIG